MFGIDDAIIGSAVGAGISGLFGMGASASSAKGIEAMNAANMQMAREQMSFQERMSSTAYQRAMADMRSSGLNPMLAFSQGGASSPSGASGGGSAASGTAARMENSLKYVGEALSSAVPSALAAASTMKDLEGKDASIAAQKAGALASVAQANNANASARATEAGMPITHARAKSANAESDAAMAEAHARKTQAEIDRDWAKVDSVTKRVLNAIGGVSDAVSIRRMLEGVRSSKKQDARSDEDHLHRQGAKGSRILR